MAPRFEVDPFWPKPLPNHWILGSTIGVGIDSQRPRLHHPPRRGDLNARTEIGLGAPTRPRASAARGAPPILEFDPDGNLVNAWGGPGDGYDWPSSNHGITMDHRTTSGSAATAGATRTS